MHEDERPPGVGEIVVWTVGAVVLGLLALTLAWVVTSGCGGVSLITVKSPAPVLESVTVASAPARECPRVDCVLVGKDKETDR